MSAATEDDVSFDDGHPGTFDSEGVEQEKTIVESPSVNDKSKTSVNKEVANAVVNGINEGRTHILFPVRQIIINIFLFFSIIP